MTKRFRSIAPVSIKHCSPKELESIRNAVNQTGSKIKYVGIFSSESETESKIFLCAQAFEKLSAVMWCRELGVKSLQLTPCLTGVSHAIQECTKWSDCDEEYCAEPSSTTQGGEGTPNVTAAVAAAAASAMNQGLRHREEEEAAVSPSVTLKRKVPSSSGGGGGGSMVSDGRELATTFREQLQSLAMQERQQAQAPLVHHRDDPPQPLLFATLYDYLMSKYYEDVMVPPPSPEFAWQRLHGWAREWYMMHKKPAGNDGHMPTVCRVMRDHPQSKSGWVRLVERKEAERESDRQIMTEKRPLRPPYEPLVRYLRGRRFTPTVLQDSKGRFFRDDQPVEAWEILRGWAVEWCLDHPEEGVTEADMHNSVIEGMYLHPDGHRKWCAHACKQNAWPKRRRAEASSAVQSDE